MGRLETGCRCPVCGRQVVATWHEPDRRLLEYQHANPKLASCRAREGEVASKSISRRLAVQAA